MQKPWVLFHLINLIHVYAFTFQTCRKNRKIFTSKQGTISNGHLQYANSERCEYLIKGEPGETITLNFHSFHTECSYDHVFVHDGASRSSNLLAVLTGKQDGTVLVSTTHMVFIILQSDDVAIGNGFNLTYSINPCPNNCSNQGKCNNHKCECLNNRYGKACQFEWCPHLCNSGVEGNKCNVTSKKCSCAQGFYGEACSLSEVPNTNLNSWHNITVSSDILKSRAGHVSAYIEQFNILLVHGGYSFEGIYDDIAVYHFSSNTWTSVNIIGQKPSARFDHAGIPYKDSLIIFGGELENGSYSNELWLYKYPTNSWQLLKSNPYIVGLKLHTLNLAEENLYIYGGQNNNQSLISSQIYIYNLNEKSWTNPPHTYGKDLYLRVYGHSAVFYKDLRSLVIFGGFHANVSLKPGELTNRLLLYNIDHNVWSVLSDMKIDKLPPPLAYHTAVVTGNYMIIFGGLAFNTSTDNCPLSNSIYYYNLHCNVWVDSKTLTKQYEYKLDKWLPGVRFSHTSAIKNKQTLLIVGGYDHANILNDVVAYQLPKSVIFLNPSNRTQQQHGRHCVHYTSAESCKMDPSCAYCSNTRSCDPNSGKTKCAHNCKGLCRHLDSCETCTIQWATRKEDANQQDEWCQWCTLDRTCYNSGEHIYKCQLSKDEIGQCKLAAEGNGSATWWESSEGKFITCLKDCQMLDNQTGLHMLQYYKPYNEHYPDGVKILKSSKDIQDQVLNKLVLPQKIDVIGVLYPYFCYNNVRACRHKIRLEGSKTVANLYVSDSNWRLNIKQKLKHVAHLGYTAVSATTAPPHKGKLFPLPPVYVGKPSNLSYVIKLTAEVEKPGISNLKLLWNHTDGKAATLLYHPITSNYLLRFQLGDCVNYTSCMGCITDSLCGWSHTTNNCLLLYKYWHDSYDDDTICLARVESQCVKCDDYFDCHTCLKDSFCVWQKYYGCKRKNNTNAMFLITEIDQCNPTCRHFNSLDDCVKKGVACVWCSQKNLCISHYEYHLHNHFGQCKIFDLASKKPCYKFKDSCVTCMKQYECGWFFNVTDPRIGRCIEGDYVGPYISSIEKTFHWAYERCPDVNECLLGIHECKNNSKCRNTDGSYECKCNDGFKGDGKVLCKKMCWPRCVQGQCTKEIKCKCDFGWKGKDCSIDCGCYNHSTCLTNACDQCHNYTTGDHCQYCVNGSYGNATTIFGCKKCDCNHHGDPQRNICNMKDGRCYCVKNTVGEHCENCLPNFSHSPAGFPERICHLNCNRSIIHLVNTSGWLVASHEKNTSPFTTCLWVLTSTNLSHDSLIYNQTRLNNSILLRIHRLKASCLESHFSVYDGIPPNPRTEEISLKSNFKLLNSICSLNSENRFYRSETGILSLLYEGRTSKKKDDLSEDEAMNELFAEYELLSCPDNCPMPFTCSTDMRCGCKDGWYGARCEHEKCKNNCSNTKGGGTCNPKSFECQCNIGFYGDDCSKEISRKQFSIESINVLYNNINKRELERLGSSMVLYENVIYVFGGTHFYDFYQPLFVQFNVNTDEWKKVEFSGVYPSARFGHCSFVYDGYVYVYGGVSRAGVLQDIWRFDIAKKTWEEIKILTYSKPLGGHTCTLINHTVYIFGGYLPDEGLNELPFKLYLNKTLSSDLIRFEVGIPRPTGLYSHVAIYDDANENIYFHGGMAFYQENVQLSHRIYVFNVRHVTWSYVEELANEVVPSLVGHTGQLIDGSLYLFGGYTDRVHFNQNVNIWKIKCNRWVTLMKDKDLEGNGRTDKMFLNSLNFNGSIYIFGGFNSDVSSNINLFSIPSDICGRHKTSKSCLRDDCHWCETSNYSACYGGSMPSMCTNNGSSIINDNICREEHTKNRKCKSFTSCISCLASHPQSRTQCQWCRCAQESGVCRSLDDRCDCKRHTTLNKCWEILCEASSCWNCGNECIWTNYLKYKSESKRILNNFGLEFNCFRSTLSSYLPKHAPVFNLSTCPRVCHSYSTCKTCLNHNTVYGIHAGTKYCIWSDKLSECLSLPILPIRCSFGRCGQLYVPSMQGECPAPCSTRKSCLSCIKSVGCGWCEQIGSKTGSCMKGDITGPYNSTCGYSGHHFLPSIVTVYSTPYTWAYALCPLKDECMVGVDDCNKETEVCHDLEEGYSCLCKKGYEKTTHSKECKPVCKGCDKGTCIRPNECICLFGWTGENCTVPCLCNGHSNCVNSTSNDICIQCFNNTQGKHCEECKPFFVGNPSNGGTCNPCKSYCNENADICVTKEEYDIMKGNYSILKSIRKGPKDTAICINCTNFSNGPQCESCLVGYFRREATNCTKCRCNGHSHTCDSKSGLNCNCSHNTTTKVGSCKTSSSSPCRFYSQCSVCKMGFQGNPEKGSQCYKILTQSRIQNVLLHSEHTVYYYVIPKYVNVNLKVNIDIFGGEVDVYVTDADNRVFMEENEVRYTQTLSLADDVIQHTDNITTNSHAVFANYNVSDTVLIIKGVKHRLVIQIPFTMHNFKQHKFFIVLSSINKTKEDVHGTFYFRQDQIKLNLTLFFLTLIVILMLILTGFILGWKFHAEYARQRRGDEERIQLQTLAKRPFASYKIRCERNGDINIIRKRKDRNTSGKNKFSHGGQNNNNSSKRITPLTVQNTEDYLASVVTVMVQFPENEFSSWNLSLASGLFQANAQQLIQVKTSHVSHGRKVDTRILSTRT